MKNVSSKFLIITYITAFVVITFVWTFNDLKSQSGSLSAVFSEPLFNVLNQSFELASSDGNTTDFEIKYSAKEHVSDILKNYLMLVKDSFGLISLYTSGITVIIWSLKSLFNNNDETDLNFIFSLFKYLKNLL